MVIVVCYEEACTISINDDGQLVVASEFGTVMEDRPIVYRLDSDEPVLNEGAFRLIGDNTFGFDIADSYDPTRALYIDPLLTYSTYLGGGDDFCYDMIIGASGDILLADGTYSYDYPVMQACFDAYTAETDAFLTRFVGSGDMVVFSSFMAGSLAESIRTIAVDADD